MAQYKVLVVNRGEIAIRVFRAAAELGWSTVAVYTGNDVSHATFADEAVELDNVSRYMNAQYLVNIARRFNCTHVHPAYGFLSENADFAALLSQVANDGSSPITFVGPPSDVLRTTSDKMLARNLAASLNVHVAPGIHVQSVPEVLSFVQSQVSQSHTAGYPVILKALDGGGGRGIRIVYQASELEDAFKRCLGESPSRQLFVEAAMIGPGWKHVEVQIVGDGTGEVTHLWERECSVQRRFQKIIEMSPSSLPRDRVQPLLDASLKMARHLKYRGLGTFEFLIDTASERWIFLEINPRLQVEHTITEEITGVDLVRASLLLSLPSASLSAIIPSVYPSPSLPKGHAIQLRLTAEDPAKSFQLSTCTIKPVDVAWPGGNGVRVDTWLTSASGGDEGPVNWEVGTDFDSLLAKVIVHGETFEQTNRKALRALREVRLGKSVTTNSELLAGVLLSPAWIDGNIDTLWLERNLGDVLDKGKRALSRTSAGVRFGSGANDSSAGSSAAGGSVLIQPGATFSLILSPSEEGPSAVKEKHTLTMTTVAHNAFPEELSGTLQTSLSSTPLSFHLTRAVSVLGSSAAAFESPNPRDPGHIPCPLTGKIVELHPALLDNGRVKKGETLVVLSVMKMETVVTAAVEWYEWGQEAFTKAKEEDKPIFLSVGYSACHWCHVLAHESFEDETTANMMNRYFVNVKVDREERPDVDRLYMSFLQATSGGGGWPMSVWLTPDLHPFLAGTYFPRHRFQQVLQGVAEAWESRRDELVSTGESVIEQMRTMSNIAPSGAVELSASLDKIYGGLDKKFDLRYGGFGPAPKFPSPSQTLHFLARYATLESDKPKADRSRDMAAETLVKMYNGGIRDVVGEGFSRYSVDEKWHVPHFEKMLYDNAQLLTSSLELAKLTAPSSTPQTLLDMASSIITYVSRDLRSTEGGFYSAEDADSLPGHGDTVKKEGAFYAWTAQQLDEVLGTDSELFNWHFGADISGNCDPNHDIQGELTGQNVLFTSHTIQETAQKFAKDVADLKLLLKACLGKLKEHRDNHRPRPHLDDKILTCWNGLMISGLSKAAEWPEATFEGSPPVLQLAEDAAAFIRSNLYNESTGELRRSFREGPGPIAQADDYAFFIQGLLDLYEASGKEQYISWAIRLQEKQDELFYDKENGGYYASAPDEHILIRMKDAQDGAEPSAVSVTLYNLNRLGHFAEDRHTEYKTKGDSIIKSNSQILGRVPSALATLASAAAVGEHGMKQFIVSGSPSSPQTQAFLSAIREPFLPNRVLVHLDPSDPPHELAKVNATLRSLIESDASKQDRRANVRICENFACGLPIYDVEELKKYL
ncbi:hypothetical protein EUX98_g3628 [Antrodiella citrinella]|uniref:ATP-grasp domain-containing protein n=1 Tax=Antrodiella citrinella TaxID=2447956 RepID=A0A4S4N481_9APHY|nr:hypothetical protein EUX98_g3628 [Antrodiella citrinella]